MEKSNHALLIMLLLFGLLIPFSAVSAPDERLLTYELKPRTSEAEFGKAFFVDYFVRNNGTSHVVLCKCQRLGEIIFGKLGENNEAPLFLDRFRTTNPPKPEDFVTIPPGSVAKFSWGDFGEEYFSTTGEWLLKIRDSFTPAVAPNGEMSWQVR
ncbi:hypothetical protein [Solemya pervernicosa gill symbiont]|uniref:hypothetical protein n=1 Tax=Solemya pervernicosa gill symbiont TaxID=642797 RepID=UPI0010827C2A|nr:hypothetical protein [Solemya pervernicosa gill symbiont]